MSSREIAELTGKRHDNVLADIRKMLDELEVSITEFSGVYKDQQDIERPCFNLPKREALILTSGYSVKQRAAIIDRWQALEEEKHLALPRTFADALQLAADQQRLIEKQAPMVEFAEAVMANGQELSLTAAGKELGYGQKKWFDLLRSKKLIVKRRYHASRNRQAEFNEASSGMVQAGYMVIKHEPDERGVYRPQTFVTPTGLNWLRKVVA